MKRSIILFTFICLYLSTGLSAATEIPANNPYIQYYGRWDFTDALTPTHSWPGVYIYAEFEGTSIGIKTDDNFCYYNVFIDDTIFSIFHGNISGVNSYLLASGLPDRNHKILLTLRNETNWTKFSFNGFVLDDGKNLLPPAERPARKIEFIGNSFTVASGNEWTEAGSAPNESYTNNYKGFGAVIAKHYNAQYQITARGGYGLVLDYLGSYSNNLPSNFDRTLVYTSLPKWNFSNWVPNLVVIALGLNDYNGWGGYEGPIAAENAELFRTKYHEFISTIMDLYPGVKILAVAESTPDSSGNGITWLADNISQVVAEENSWGHANVFYASFPYYDGGYVNNGHPTVATDQKIADTLIFAIDTINAWVPYVDVSPPRITEFPSSPFTVYDTSYVLNIKTDSYATLRYSTEDKSYNQMENVFTTTGNRTHSVTLSCQHGAAYKYYLRGIDIYGNAMDTSAVVSFVVDTTKSVIRWTLLSYDDSHWKKGRAPLSSIDESTTATLINPVGTAYFRYKLTLDSVSTLTALALITQGHDGAVIYIDGNELGRVNMPTGSEICYNTFALSSLDFTQKYPQLHGSISNKFVNGENIVAIEVHAGNAKNISTWFDSYLVNNSRYFYTYGSEWSYYDEGNAPLDQILDKTTSVQNTASVPRCIELYQNYPNPFNPVTNISFTLPERSEVTLKIYDLLGREVKTLVCEQLQVGRHTCQWNAEGFSSGIYFYRLQARNLLASSGNGRQAVSFVETKKLILIK